MFYTDYIEGRKIIRSDLLSGVECFFTTRELCLFSKEEDMTDNRKIVEDFLGQKMVTNQPVHGINIEKIETGKFFYEKTDGLLIERQGSAYMNFGDCTPLVFYYKGVIMISHAGWRGTLQKMAQVSVLKFIEEYKANPDDIKVVIGPAICEKCYEVGKDVYSALYKTIKNPEGFFREEKGKFFVDLKGINKQQLVECDVEKIDVCPYCTACGEKLFFSYRYENHTGYRHSVVVKL